MYAETISSLLDKIEGLLGRIGAGSGKQALDLLLLMDEVNARIQEQEGRGALLLAEKTQFVSIQANIKENAALILRELGGPVGLLAERARHTVAEDAWWWRLEQVVAEKRKKQVRRTLRILGIAALVVGVLAGIYWLFLQPDPIDIARMNAREKAQAVVQAGNLDEALLIIDEGLKIARDDPQLIVLRGVLLEKSGRMDEAEQAFGEAQLLMKDPAVFHFARAEAYLGFDWVDEAVSAAEQGVAEDPESANGFLILGQCLQTQGNVRRAREAYQEAIRLAELSGEAGIAAQASVLMAYLPQESAPNIPVP